MFQLSRILMGLVSLLVLVQKVCTEQTASQQRTPSSGKIIDQSSHPELLLKYNIANHTHNITELLEAVNELVLDFWDELDPDRKHSFMETFVRIHAIEVALYIELMKDTTRDASLHPHITTHTNTTSTTSTTSSSSSSTSHSTASTTLNTTHAHLTTTLGTPHLSPDAVHIHNLSPRDICYVVEFTSGSLPFPLPDHCDFSADVLPGSYPGIYVPAHTSTLVYTGVGFNGPFNAIIDGERGVIEGRRALVGGRRGARCEINFADDGGGTWFDVDYEFGLGNCTLGPTRGAFLGSEVERRRATQGERDVRAKAQGAWGGLTRRMREELLGWPRYIRVSVEKGGEEVITHLYHDEYAPAVFNYFLQCVVKLQGYVVPGSYPGFEREFGPETLEAKMRPVADSFAWFVAGGHDMEIVVY